MREFLKTALERKENVLSLGILLAGLTVLTHFLFKIQVPDYRYEMIDEINLAPERGDKVYFEELDSDGAEEIIIKRNNVVNNASFIVYRSNHQLYDQVNFPEQSIKNSDLFFSDMDGDGLKEINIFTWHLDSAFLYSVEFSSQEMLINRQFIAKARRIQGNEDFAVGAGRSIDMDLDGREELVFYFHGFFNDYPRKIFIYDWDEGNLKSSDHLNAKFVITDIIDLDGDRYPEILLTNHPSANNNDTTVFLNDHHAWLVAFDRNLDFLFEPRKSSGINTQFCLSVIEQNGINNILFYEIIRAQGIKNNKIYILNAKNEIEADIEVPPELNMKNPILYRYGKEIYLEGQDELFQITDDLQLVSRIRARDNSVLIGLIDLADLSGPLYVFRDLFRERIYLYEGAQNILTLDFPTTIYQAKGTTNPDGGQVVYFSGREGYFGVALTKNRHTFLRLILHISVLIIGFVGYLGTIHIVDLVNKDRQRKQLALQLGVIRHQFDAHFVHNALNSISSFVLQGNKFIAHDYINKFSSLLRYSLENPNEVIISIEEEMEFVENYLQIQKLRFKDKLNYTLAFDEEVNLLRTLPKSLVFAFVENAIKHGIGKVNPLVIDVRVVHNHQQVEIRISDNGTGFEVDTKMNGIKPGGSIDLALKYCNVYNDMGKGSATFEIKKNKKGSGTQSLISLKNKL